MSKLVSGEWAERLGLATTPLFGPDRNPNDVAMLDGMAGSFILSEREEPQPKLFGDGWAWSSMMRHHVIVDPSVVTIRSADGGRTERVTRHSIDSSLEEFLRYLERPRENRVTDVIDHVIAAFQALRVRLSRDSNNQLKVFLSLLALKLANPGCNENELPDLLQQLPNAASQYGIDLSNSDFSQLTPDVARRFFEELLHDQMLGVPVLIDLTVRHAGSELFQAAQLAPPISDGQDTLWGLSATRIRVRPSSLKGVAYTPVGLSRSLAERTLAMIEPPKSTLTILDPACGSGSFLVEALAAISRLGWKAKIHVVGYDIEATAVTAALFALACAVKENPSLSIKYEVEQRDFLQSTKGIVEADVILMNPPYQSWGDMNTRERAIVKEFLGSHYKGRPDKCMLFVNQALRVSKPNALICSILPVGVMAGESATSWRLNVMEKAAPRLMAVFGDHSLFRYATVNVGAIILDKALPGTACDTQVVWASERPGAASASLRAVRRASKLTVSAEAASSADEQKSWSIYIRPSDDIARNGSWLASPRLLSQPDRSRLEELEYQIGDLFDIRLGIRAGERSTFVLPQDAFQALPSNEKKGFMPIAEKRGIVDGQIEVLNYIFVGGEAIETEGELKQKYPTYCERFLNERKEALSQRLRNQDKWWRLSEARNLWRNLKTPRIVSRQWIRNTGFAVDAKGTYAVVQGYAWFPKKSLLSAVRSQRSPFDILDILRYYCILFSSDVFYEIAREYSTNSAGGQIDLQKKYSSKVPVPLLSQVLAENSRTSEVLESENSESFPPLDIRNRFAAICYGLPS